MRLRLLILILLGLPALLEAAGPVTGAGFRLRLEPGDWERVSILPTRPAGARVDLERGAPQAAGQRASQVGSLLPGRVWVNGAIGRVATSPSGSQEVFWTFGDRLGRIFWPPDAGPLAPGVDLAGRTDRTFASGSAERLQELAEELEAGTWIEILLRPAPVVLRIAAGPSGEEDARRELEVQQARDQARTPLRGLRAPAWRSRDGAPRAWMQVGRILVHAMGEELDASLRLAGSRLEPIPPGPDASR